LQYGRRTAPDLRSAAGNSRTFLELGMLIGMSYKHRINSVLGILARTVPPTYAQLYSGELTHAA
jgi:hypothetical protein